MIQDLVDDGSLFDHRNDLHLSLTIGTKQRITFECFSDPTGTDRPALAVVFFKTEIVLTDKTFEVMKRPAIPFDRDSSGNPFFTDHRCKYSNHAGIYVSLAPLERYNRRSRLG